MSSLVASEPDIEAVHAALRVLDDHFAALNARDSAALANTLHFPHYRMGRGGMKIWETSERYLDDFYARAGDGWARSAFLFRNVVAASAEKVHLDIAFVRYDQSNQIMGSFRSLWVIAQRNGKWAAEARSSFAV